MITDILCPTCKHENREFHKICSNDKMISREETWKCNICGRLLLIKYEIVNFEGLYTVEELIKMGKIRS